jgi:anti-sigma factor RsiW
MEHVSDGDLIRLTAGDLPADRRGPVAEHLRSCTRCGRRMRAFEATWRLMGEWTVPGTSRDLWPQVRAALDEERPPRRRWGRGRARFIGRAAALIVASVVLGHLAARWARPLTTFPRRPQPGVAARGDEEAVAQALYLRILKGSPTGLAESMLGFEAPAREEQPR